MMNAGTTEEQIILVYNEILLLTLVCGSARGKELEEWV